MKGFLIAILAALAISQTYANPIGKCPAEDGPDDVLLPNAADCGSFYKCLAGTPTEMNCPSGLHWNAKTSECDYPANAGCTETETKPPIEPTSSPKPTELPVTEPPVERPDHCPAVDGPIDVLLPNPEDCHSFFKCSEGKPVLLKCPEGQEWADALQRCDYPEIAQCTVSGTAKPTTSAPEKPTDPSVTKPPVERPDHCPAVDGPVDVLLPNPEDCHSFFKCSEGKPVLLNCPEGQEWADALQRCDYPEIAQCTVSGTVKPTTSAPEKPTDPSATTPTLQPGQCPAVDGPTDVLLPNPDDCGSFFKCQNGHPVKIDCPVGQEWAESLHRCDWPSIAQCSIKIVKPEHPREKPAPVLVAKECPAEDGEEDVLLPNPADCGSFFKCLRGEPILQQCPAGLHWSVEGNECDYPENAKCET